MRFPDSDFWNFSIDFYARAEVEKHCIDLQAQHQLNVNLVLLALWVSSKQRAILSVSQWQQLISVALPWQEIIMPLRKSRQFIKDATIAWPKEFQTETRQSISEIELNAEHMQQLRLEKSVNDFDIALNDTGSSEQTLTVLVTENISHYLQALNNAVTIDMFKQIIAELISNFEKYQENKKISA